MYAAPVAYLVWLIGGACLFVLIPWAFRVINRWAVRDMDRYLDDVGGYEPIARREP